MAANLISSTWALSESSLSNTSANPTMTKYYKQNPQKFVKSLFTKNSSKQSAFFSISVYFLHYIKLQIPIYAMILRINYSTEENKNTFNDSIFMSSKCDQKSILGRYRTFSNQPNNVNCIESMLWKSPRMENKFDNVQHVIWLARSWINC